MILEQVKPWIAAGNSVWLNEPPLDALHRGDHEAFNFMMSEYQPAAYRLAFHILADPAAAEDATQNAFLDAFCGIHRFHGGSFRAWLLRIVAYTCYDDLRRQLRHPSISLDETQEEEPETARWIMDSNQATPEEETERKEMAEEIVQVLDRLPQDLQAVSMLVDVEEMDYAEASRRIQRPVGTVKSRLFRARIILRRNLRPYLETGNRG